MKKQSGFTLIELLLVVAIIGIISAIAVPAFIGLRESAKDKAAQANCADILTAFMAAASKAEQDGITIGGTTYTIVNKENINTLVGTNANNALVPEIWREKNPWNTVGYESAYRWDSTLIETDMDTAMIGMTEGKMGQVQLAPGIVDGNLVIGAAVLLNKPTNKKDPNSKVMVKIQGIG